MKIVVLVADKGTRFCPLIKYKSKGMVRVYPKLIVTHCFQKLLDLEAEKLVIVVRYKRSCIVGHYRDSFRNVPMTYAHWPEQKGLAHALLTVEEYIDGKFIVILVIILTKLLRY